MQNNRRTNQQSLPDDDDYDDQVQPTKRFRPNVDNKNIIERERRALPITQVRDQLLAYVRKNKTSIIIGETGSGKSTQFCLDENLHSDLIIAVTQPRRVAAVTLATRVADEMNTDVGVKVGYSVRFENCCTAATSIAYMTDGMLLREALHDPLLKRYGIIIIDEAHERTLHTDIMLGVVKRCQKERFLQNSAMLPTLKVIVMSATMDVDLFSCYFDSAPVYYIEGRTYPIEIFHAPQLENRQEQDYVYNALVAVFQLHRSEPVNHDMLVFLTGRDEIETAVRRTRELVKSLVGCDKRLRAMPLYAAMNSNSQMKVFQSIKAPNTRKVIYATNIAETSLTIPGIRIVIDSGKVKMRIYKPSSRVDLLRVAPVSQAQACQRTGRAGRNASGKCYRLYTSKDFEKFVPLPQPEILRCNISGVLLELLRMGITDITSFEFVEMPSPESIVAAIRELKLLGAIDVDEHDDDHHRRVERYALTDIGRQLVSFPLAPNHAKILLAAAELGCLDEALTIVAAMSHETIFVSCPNTKVEQRNARRKFETPEGDHVMMLKAFRAYSAVRRTDNNQKLKDWCMENFVQERQMATITKIRSQLREVCLSLKLRILSCGSDLDKIRRALCIGLFANACEHDLSCDKYKLIDSNLKVKIHPTSCMFRSSPSAIVFTDLVMTTELYARDVTVVDVDWIKELIHSRKSALFVRS